MSDHSVTHRLPIEIKNERAASMRLIIEPWGEEYDVLENMPLLVVFEGPDVATDKLEIVWTESAVILASHCGGCVLEVWCEGQMIN